MITPSHEGISHLVADALAPPLPRHKPAAAPYMETDARRCS